MESYNLVYHVSSNQLLPFVILYFGPETMLPLASVLAALVGILIMFSHRVIALARKTWRSSIGWLCSIPKNENSPVSLSSDEGAKPRGTDGLGG